MASSDLSKHFRLTLMRVSEILTEKNVHDIAFLCEDITPARREQLKNATDLFAALQGHDLLSEKKVKILVGWLDELKLLEASKHLKKYSQVHLQSGVTLQQKCLSHAGLPLTYFCVSCDSKLCPECVYKSHGRDTGCDVIELNGMHKEIARRRETLQTNLEDATISLKSTKQKIDQDQQSLSNYFDAAQEDVLKNYLFNIEKLERERLVHLKRLLEERSKNLVLRSSIDHLRKTSKGSSGDVLHQLKVVDSATKEINEIKSKIEEQKEEVQTTIALVGVVAVGRNQIVKIMDARRLNQSVGLVCMSGDQTKVYWRYEVRVGDQASPVVMSYKRMWWGKGSILFAVGKTVFAVHPHWLGMFTDSVESVTTTVINEVADGSWINSVAAGTGKFFISVENGATIREYLLGGEARKTIALDDIVHANGILSVAQCDNVFAVIYREGEEVILISDKDNVKQSASIKSESPGLSPVLLLGSFCLWVLYISKTDEKKWEVVQYDEKGRLKKVCSEGTSISDGDIPLSITWFDGNGYISFADSTVVKF